MRFARAAVALLTLAGCSGVKEDFDDICHAEERAGLNGTEASADKAVKLSQWILGRLRTSEAKTFLRNLSSLDPGQKAETLRAEAAKHGVSPCPIADSTWGAH